MNCDQCGAVLTGRQQRFCSTRCRSRHRRRGPRKVPTAVAETTATTPSGQRVNPDAAPPGRCRAALEAWLAEEVGLPRPLTAAARALATEVDNDPSSSPLWGRYLDAIGQLLSASATDPPPRDILDEIREEEAPR